MAGHPPRDGPPPPPRHAAQTRRTSQGDSAWPPHPHNRAHNTWVAGPCSPPGGRAVRGGGPPDLRRPSQRQKATPLVTPFRHPHGTQHQPAGAHALGQVPSPHTHTNRTRDTQVAEPPLPNPGGGRPRERRRLTPDAPHNGGRPPPWGRPPTNPAACSPHKASKPRGQCWAPTPADPRPQQVGGGPLKPAQKVGSQRRGSA